MKAVLISIQPKWCELIASGEKTIEVRKSRPLIETPFKCYIYCSAEKHKGEVLLIDNNGKQVALGDYRNAFHWKNVGNGKVIGEFVCDRIEEYNCEFWGSDDYMSSLHAMEQIRIFDYVDEDDLDWKEYCYVTGNEVENPDDCALCRESCLTYSEIRKYIGKGDKTFYGWRISNLKIYDKQKELGEFRSPCPKPNSIYVEDCMSCKHFYVKESSGRRSCGGWIKRPPQSWCYVEEI